MSTLPARQPAFGKLHVGAWDLLRFLYGRPSPSGSHQPCPRHNDSHSQALTFCSTAQLGGQRNSISAASSENTTQVLMCHNGALLLEKITRQLIGEAFGYSLQELDISGSLEQIQ